MGFVVTVHTKIVQSIGFRTIHYFLKQGLKELRLLTWTWR